MKDIQFFFSLTLIIEFFDRIEIFNKDLQMSELYVIDSYQKVEAVMFNLEASRDFRLEVISQKDLHSINDLDIRDRELPRHKISKRLESNNEFGKHHIFHSPKDTDWEIYFEIFDRILMSLKSRLKTDSSQFFKSLEAFAIGNTSYIDKIIGFYDDDFDKDRLASDRDMFLNLTSKSNKTIRNLKEAVEFLRENEWEFSVNM